MKLSQYAKNLQDSGFEITFVPEREYGDPRKELEYIEQIDYVINGLENGNDAVWFLANVKISFKGIDSDYTYMGQCSYDSFDEFTGTDNDYFDDMLNECYKQLIKSFKNIFPEVAY